MPASTRTIALTSGFGVGTFAGLMGLGGAELRMPILIRQFGLPPQRAVPVNLAVSLATLTVGAFTRLAVVSMDTSRLGWEIVAVAVGSVIAALISSSLLHRLPDGLHTKLIAVVLLAVACLMAFAPMMNSPGHGLVPEGHGVRLAAGFGIGLLVGTVSAMFGVAGGQMTIPALVFGFGLDLKLAGTASLLINLPTVFTAVVRFAARSEGRANSDLKLIALPMAVGSVVGAATGGVFVNFVPTPLLRLVFAAVLAASAIALLRRKSTAQSPASLTTSPEPPRS